MTSALVRFAHALPSMKREEPRATHDWQEQRGGLIDVIVRRKGPFDDDDRVDQAIAESFPASDPPSWNGGIERPDHSG